MFGERLCELRKSKNLSQKELGEMFSITSNAIYSWENGKSQPSIEIINKLAQYFNVTTDYLLGSNQEDRDNIDRLKIALKEAGMLNGENENLTKEDLQKAMQIVNMLKEKKDTDK